MAENIGSKSKTLYVMKILLELTDEKHHLTMQQILNELMNYGIYAARKSLYSDFETLRTYGLDIIMEKNGRNYDYWIGSREFELAELKLLVDSIQSARFISEKKSNELIRKLENLTSKYEANELQHQVFVTERVKSVNEQILYNIDQIHKAIAENSQISFQYFSWDVNKKKVLRHEGKIYEESPWALTLAEEYYYLVCFDSKGRFKYFRVDKMLNISLLNKDRLGKKEFSKFDIASYSKKRFRMFDGEEKLVTLFCHNKYANAVIDRFGKDVELYPVDDSHFEVHIEVAATRQFYAWVFAMSDGMEITAPQEVVEEVRLFAKQINKQYKKNK